MVRLLRLAALEGCIVRHPPQVFELGHDAVDECVRNKGFVASALMDLARRRLSVEDVVDTETKCAGELPDVMRRHAHARFSHWVFSLCLRRRRQVNPE
jgi:hypothetical protein